MLVVKIIICVVVVAAISAWAFWIDHTAGKN